MPAVSGRHVVGQGNVNLPSVVLHLHAITFPHFYTRTVSYRLSVCTRAPLHDVGDILCRKLV